MTDNKDDMKPFDRGKELNKFGDQLPAEFLSDASEGLNLVQDDQQLETVLQQLNLHMHQQLAPKKTHRTRKGIGDLSWTYWAIVFILLLTIAAFVVIRMFLKK